MKHLGIEPLKLFGPIDVSSVFKLLYFCREQQHNLKT